VVGRGGEERGIKVVIRWIASFILSTNGTSSLAFTGMVTL